MVLRFLVGRPGRLDDELVLMRKLSDALLILIWERAALQAAERVCSVCKYTRQTVGTNTTQINFSKMPDERIV